MKEWVISAAYAVLIAAAAFVVGAASVYGWMFAPVVAVIVFASVAVLAGIATLTWYIHGVRERKRNSHRGRRRA